MLAQAERTHDGMMEHATKDRIAALDVSVRAMGSGKVHHARVGEAFLYPAEQFGAPYTACTPPVVARCGVVLRHWPIVVIPEGDALESWRRNRNVCRACEFAIRVG